jgi:hypothetical protein
MGTEFEPIPARAEKVAAEIVLASIRLGFLLNFNVPLMKDGIKRMVV